MIGRSIALFGAAALAEIAGAYLIWSGLREGVVAAQQPSDQFGRVLAAYGGMFVAGSLLWGIAFDGFRPDRYDWMGPSSAWQASA